MNSELTTLDEVIERIFHKVRTDLMVLDSALVADDHVETELHEQVRLLMLASFTAFGLHVDTPDMGVVQQGRDVGISRAAQGIHPSDSLLAARLLFAHALPELNRFILATTGHVDETTVAITLSEQIYRMVGSASLAYVDVLFDRITAVQREERSSVARDLHDRVAHSMASGLMKLELAEAELDPKVAAKVRDARRLLHQSLIEAQSIATELRQIVGSGSLKDSIRRYIEEAGVQDLEISLTETGTPRPIAPAIAEQVFLLVREALRNTITHAGATTAGIHLAWEDKRVLIRVWDHGRGFSPLRIRPGAMGLVGMRERAELIGASLTLESTPGDGTRVSVEVPYVSD